MGTAVAVVVGATTLTSVVKKIAVINEVNSVGRFSIEVDNTGGAYNGVFNANDAITINIGGATILGGYVDVVRPKLSDSPDVLTQSIILEGRDYARELVDLTVNKNYPNATDTSNKVDDIAKYMLTAAGSNITFTPAGVSATMHIKSKNEYLLNNFRLMSERTGYDFYVDKDGALQWFPSGASSSGIALSLSPTTNIISLTRDAKNGTDIKNYILALGGQVRDSWTEFNAADWTASNCTITDDITDSKGGGAMLKITRTDVNPTASLVFPRYGFDYLDFTKMSASQISFSVKIPTGAAVATMAVKLFDTDGNAIHRMVFSDVLNSMLAASRWETVSLSLGGSNQIWPWVDISGAFGYLVAGDKWTYANDKSGNPSTTFNWKIKEFAFLPSITPGGDPDVVYLDNLTMPETIRFFSIAQDVTSQNTYGVRKITIDQKNSGGQADLDAFTARALILSKDPQTSMSAVVPGYVGLTGPVCNWKPGYNCTVYVTQEGINSGANPISYRMVEIQHMYNTDATTNGWDYYVNLKLNLASESFNLRRWEAMHSEVYIQRELREMVNALQKAGETEVDAYPTFPTALGNHQLEQTLLYSKVWEAEDPPVVQSAGSGEVTDTDANGNYAVKRLSSAASGTMLYVPVAVPGVCEYIAVFRLKVTARTSTDDLFKLQIYNEAGSAVVKTATFKPTNFTTAGTYQLFGIRGMMKPSGQYSFKIEDFVTGITDLYCDWIAVTNDITPYASVGITVSSGSDNDSAGDASDADDNGTTSDTDTNANNGAHTHGLTGYAGLLMDGVATTLYAAASAGGSPTVAFTVGIGTPVGPYTFLVGTTEAGEHTHAVTSEAHDHAITSPTHSTSITSPGHTHSNTEPSGGHSHAEN